MHTLGVEHENLEKEAKEKMKCIDMTACRLCFQAFLQDKSTLKFTTMLERVYSEPIYDASEFFCYFDILLTLTVC